MYGKAYVIEHCVETYMRMMEERRYKAYLTDALMILTENTARYVGGKQLTKRWVVEFLPKDNRTAEEIAADIIKNAGLIQGGELNGFDVSGSPPNSGQIPVR